MNKPTRSATAFAAICLVVAAHAAPAIAQTIPFYSDSRFLSEGRIPFSGTSTFMAADGSELPLDFEGSISILPNGELRWVADFTPAVEKVTGRFSEVDSGSIVMLASSPPIAPGEVPFSSFGEGHLIMSK